MPANVEGVGVVGHLVVVVGSVGVAGLVEVEYLGGAVPVVSGKAGG